MLLKMTYNKDTTRGNTPKQKGVKQMKKCKITFSGEICEGLIGKKEEVRAFLKKEGRYDYEGVQRIRSRELHQWEKVLVFSYQTYEGTGFICYKVEQ